MTTTDSLLTKYRPSSFDKVVGHDKQVESIQRLCQTQNPNAFLLTGGSGLGKTTLARLITDELGVSNNSLHEIDAASSAGKVDQIRELIESLSYKSIIKESDRKAVIIDEIQAAHKQVLQTLLKAIEEPPEGVVWIFCTTESDYVPKTIKTRCYEYDLQPVDGDTIFDFVADVADKESFTISDEVLDFITEESRGSPRQALNYLAVCQDEQNVDDAKELISVSIEGDASQLAKKLVTGKHGGWYDLKEEARKAVAENGNRAEAVRTGLINYMGKALLNTKSEEKAAGILNVMEPFTEPYHQQEGIAPLLRSIGIVLLEE